MKTKLIFLSIGIGTLIGNSIVLYWTWIGAFLRGGKITIAINVYNEMWFEFFFIPITMMIGLWTLYQFMFKGILIRKRTK